VYFRRALVIQSFSVLVFAAIACALPAQAQTLGTVTGVSAGGACPTGRGFDTSGAMTCYSAKLTQCPGTDDLYFVYGVEAPTGTPAGTIVILSGKGGTIASDPPSDVTYVQDYVNAHYQVVQIAWGATAPGIPWEYTNVSGGTNPPNIRVAACRPASFLNWVRNGGPNNNYQGIWGGNGGMCVQGESAGGAAAAYALAWYNAGAATASFGQGYLDKALMKSGPTLSDIKQGCEVQNGVNSQYTQICSGTQVGCSGWQPTEPPGYHLEYVQGAQDSVNSWSGNTSSPACGDNRPNITTTYDTTWAKMSIVDFTETQQPSFNYPNTAMSAWLCESTADGVTPNNSAPQGELFYLQFTSLSQLPANAYTVNAVINCPDNPENVDGGTVAATNQNGMAAIVADMTTGVAACTKRH
jgi:hypothetical protein